MSATVPDKFAGVYVNDGSPYDIRKATDCHCSPPNCDCIEARVHAAELTTLFNLRWKADMRAIKRWQAANPGNELTWPNHADLVVWLMGELRKKARPDSELPLVRTVLCANCWHPQVNHDKSRCWVYLRRKRPPHECPCLRWAEWKGGPVER